MRNQFFNKCLETTILSRQTSTTYDKNILQSLPPFVTSLKYTELYIVAFIIPFWKVFCMIGQKEKNKKDSQNCLYTAIFQNQILIKIVCFKIRKSLYKLGVTLTIIILSITSIPKSVFFCSKVVLFFQ